MPIKLEQIQSPNEADWNDLNKIHQETPNNGLVYDQAQLEQWLASGGWLIAGRFNDRIIGVILAKRQDNIVELSQAAVRQITQRRGVMHQMLHFIQRWADENAIQLAISDCPDFLADALSHRHFKQNEGTWRYNTQQT